MIDVPLTVEETRRIASLQAEAQRSQFLASVFEKIGVISASSAAAGIAIAGTALSHRGVHVDFNGIKWSLICFGVATILGFTRMAHFTTHAAVAYAVIMEIQNPERKAVYGLDAIGAQNADFMFQLPLFGWGFRVFHWVLGDVRNVGIPFALCLSMLTTGFITYLVMAYRILKLIASSPN